MYEWENAFNQTILERGKKYANGNRVKIVSTDYKTTSAVVRGSQQYNVSVRLCRRVMRLSLRHRSSPLQTYGCCTLQIGADARIA